VSDYADGKVDWMASNLPVEGTRGPYVGQFLVDVPTCRPDELATDVAAGLTGDGVVVTVGRDQIAVGKVDAERLRRALPDQTILEIMEVVPQSLRPSVLLADVDERAAGRLVTTGEGGLLGALDPSAVTSG
jgi:hypothetical protein